MRKFKAFALVMLCLISLFAFSACRDSDDATTAAPVTTAPPEVPLPPRVEVCEPYTEVKATHLSEASLIRTEYNTYGLPAKTYFHSPNHLYLTVMYIEHVYDELGYLTKSICYVAENDNDALVGVYRRGTVFVWERNAQGRPICATVSDYGVRSTNDIFDGNVKITVSYRANGNFDRIECTDLDRRIVRYRQLYNEDGSLASESRTENGDDIFTTEYTYRDDGKTVGQVYYDLGDRKIPSGNYIYEFENGIITTDGRLYEYDFSEDGLLLGYTSTANTFSIAYNGNRNITEVTVSGKAESEIRVEYDTLGRPISIDNRNGNRSKKEISYPEEGKISEIEYRYFGSATNPYYRGETVSTYNEKGQLVKSEVTTRLWLEELPSSDPTTDVYEHEYDVFGRICKTTTYKYNAKGDLSNYTVDDIFYATDHRFKRSGALRSYYNADGTLTGTSTVN